MPITIRHEQPSDIDNIVALTIAAFASIEHSSHTEHFIVNALRRSDALTLSLVAEDGHEIVGHVAASPVTLSSGAHHWFGLGPISVRPDRQLQGIGSHLMKEALQELQHLGAVGCVLLGDPKFYGRFGFKAYPNLVLAGVPGEYFQALPFSGEIPDGAVEYHDGFKASDDSSI